MKLLKYVMTSDAGLAPNPYFGICSLALCTPNHMNAKLCVGDWIVGHSCKATGQKLIHAMRITRVLGMAEYFSAYPEKRPRPDGTPIEQRGDNLYDYRDDSWYRVPSAFHNAPEALAKDQGRTVFLAEGAESYWYFGGLKDPEVSGFSEQFPELIKDRQGFSYVQDQQVIARFEQWLKSMAGSGLIGLPRDPLPPQPSKFLLAIDPVQCWVENTKCEGEITDGTPSGSCRPAREGSCQKEERKTKRGCR